MRYIWRLFILKMMIVCTLAGCHQLPADKSVQDLRPIQSKDTVAAKQPLTAPEIGQTLVAQAKMLEDARKTVDAIAMYEKMRTTEPAQAWLATKKIAQLQLRTNDLDRAETEYRLILQNSPRDVDALFAMGDISCRRGHYAIADRFLREALTVQPDHAQALVCLAMAQAHNGDYQGSIDSFKKVKGFSEAEAYCEVAFVLNLQKKHEDALRAYQTALTHDPKLDKARNEMARIYQENPTLTARTTTPFRVEKRGAVELEPAPAVQSEGTERLMMQRPALPPLPDVDRIEWTSKKK